MQLVIELSDETYDKVINPHNWYDPNNAITDIAKAIEYGTPLPKGHGRLIDVNEVEEYLENIQQELDGWGDTDSAIEIAKARMGLDTVSTIIEADKAESEDRQWE